MIEKKLIPEKEIYYMMEEILQQEEIYMRKKYKRYFTLRLFINISLL